MNKQQADVELFHKTFGGPAPTYPTLTPCENEEENARMHKLRVALLQEELDELAAALENNDLTEVADALVDLEYLVLGAAVSFGLDLEPLFDEVHSSNMSKLPPDGVPLLREDGKIMKPQTYKRPDLAPIIAIQNRRNCIGDSFENMNKEGDQ